MSVFQFQEQIRVWMILGLLATNNHSSRLKTVMVLVKESQKIQKYPKFATYKKGSTSFILCVV